MALGSLKLHAEAKTEGISKATYYKVDPRILLFEDGFNVREEGPDLDAHLGAMYLSMKAGSKFPPLEIRVEDERMIVVDGHCRTRTALRLIDEGIDITLTAQEFRGNEIARVSHMLTSAQGKPLTPLEAGRGYFRLKGWGQSVAEIASTTGVSRTTIENGLILAEAPVAVQKMIAQGEVSGHTAIGALREHGAKAADVLTDKLGVAKADGKKKVTQKQMKPVKKERPDFAPLIAGIRASLDVEKEFDLMEGDLDEQKVCVPGNLLRELFAMHDAFCTK